MALCYHCFREKGAETVCPFCGYDPTGSAKKHPMALRPESILNGRYILGRVLGQGGFGITYIAQDYQTKERVAVKEYFPTEFAGRTNGTHVQIYSEEREAGFAYGKAQFLEEARTLAAVTGSENIVRIHSYFEENGTAYFTMDYVEGLPLDEYLKTRGAHLKAAEAAALLLPLMGALDTVHRKGIVHRDIAPDNIIISPEGKARLIDFGAARYSTGEKSKSLDVILKHGFAPMEQYTRRGRQGPWTDVYAMAATYYFALTGKVPPDAIERIAEDTLEPPSALGSDLSAGEEQVLLKGLAVQAPERWQTMGEFRAALQAVRGAIDAETRRAEQERKTREERERKAREKAEREKQEKAQREAQKKAEQEAARAARQAEREAAHTARQAEREAKKGTGAKKSKLPLVLGVAAFLVAALVFVVTRGGSPISPALSDTSAVLSAAEETSGAVSEAAAAASAEPRHIDLAKSFVDPLSEWSVYDELIAQIKSETDSAKRTELMHQAEDILMATHCVIPIYYYNDIYLQKSYVDGVFTTPFACKYFMFSSLSTGADTMHLQLCAEPETLDPALNAVSDYTSLTVNSFSGLYAYDATGKTVPACAAGYEVSEDGLTYTVTLREGLKWSDGSDLTARDFVYSWKRAASTELSADYSYLFSGIAGYPDDLQVSAPDDRTFRFVLSAPCAYMEDLMSFSVFCPVKQSAVESYAGWKNDPGGWCREAGFVSNGAYVCTAWDHDLSMTYEKNPYWYDADKVTVRKLELTLSIDEDAILSAYNEDRLDFCDNVPVYSAGPLLQTSDFHTVNSLGTFYYVFNASSDVFAGKTPQQAAAMREAVSMLIDRSFICESILQVGQLPASTFIPLGMADGSGGLFTADAATGGYYDPYAINTDPEGTRAKAVELLKSAGYRFDAAGMLSAETPLRMTLISNNSASLNVIAEAIQENLASVGIELSIDVMEWSTCIQARRSGEFDLAREGWIADFNDPINMLELWTTDSTNNDCQFGSGPMSAPAEEAPAASDTSSPVPTTSGDDMYDLLKETFLQDGGTAAADDGRLLVIYTGRTYLFYMSGLDLQDSYTINTEGPKDSREYNWSVTFSNGKQRFSVSTASWRFDPGHEEQRLLDEMQHSLWLSEEGTTSFQVTSVPVTTGHTDQGIFWSFELPEDMDFDLANVTSFSCSAYDGVQELAWKTPALGS